MFSLLVERSIMQRLEALPEKEATNLRTRLKVLRTNPFPDGQDKKEIKGTRKTAYRLRIGGYRFFYLIDRDQKIVRVTEFLTAEQAHRTYGRV